MKKILLGLAIFLVLAACAVGMAAVYYLYGEYEGEVVRVEIPNGATAEDIENILKTSLGDDFGAKTARARIMNRGTLSAAHGSYLVKPGADSWSLGYAIARGNQTPVRLTFNNMRTIGDLAKRVAETLELDSASFHAAASEVLAAAGLTPEQYTSAFIPDTYEFYWTAKPASVVERLYGERQTFWNDERRAAAAALGLTPEDVHALASIVEGETAKRDERPKVARLYLNRLERKMPLQADPTVKFAVGDPTLRRITNKHLQTKSPYNTYLNPGLPPGPISIAEKGTLDAVLNAPKHNYLYMCAKSDFSGYHDFAQDYSRHRINAARYHLALSARGIR